MRVEALPDIYPTRRIERVAVRVAVFRRLRAFHVSLPCHYPPPMHSMTRIGQL